MRALTDDGVKGKQRPQGTECLALLLNSMPFQRGLCLQTLKHPRVGRNTTKIRLSLREPPLKGEELSLTSKVASIEAFKLLFKLYLPHFDNM